MSGLKYAFKDYKSLDYTFTGEPKFIDVDPALGTATVEAPTLLKPEYKVGGSPPQKHINTFTLKRQDDVWTIVDLKSAVAK